MKVIFYCGHNTFGQLNKDEDNIAIPSPKKISVALLADDSTNGKIFIGWDKLFIIKDSRCISITGFHQNVQEILCQEKVKHIEASLRQTFVLTENSKCYQLRKQGLEELPQCSAKEIACGEKYTISLTEAGEVCVIQDLKCNPLFVPLRLSTHKILAVSCGKEHVILLTNSGEVLTFGGGSRGQLGHGGNEMVKQPTFVEALGGVNILGVSAGGWHSAVVSVIGDVYIWGWNEAGQLGLPCKNIANLNKGAEENRTMKSHTEDRKSYCEGSETQMLEINVQSLPFLMDFPKEPMIVKVSCGARHTAVLTDAGRLLTWGWNEYGQLCHGDTISRDQPCLVQFFSDKQLKVLDVECKFWSTVITACDAASD